MQENRSEHKNFTDKFKYSIIKTRKTEWFYRVPSLNGDFTSERVNKYIEHKTKVARSRRGGYVECLEPVGRNKWRILKIFVSSYLR